MDIKHGWARGEAKRELVRPGRMRYVQKFCWCIYASVNLCLYGFTMSHHTQKVSFRGSSSAMMIKPYQEGNQLQFQGRNNVTASWVALHNCFGRAQLISGWSVLLH
jgi:hypothetical protein